MRPRPHAKLTTPSRRVLAGLLACALCLAAAAATSARAPRRRAAGLLLVNGKVFTADARGTLAEAVAVEGNRIVAVGTTRELQTKFAAARTVDLRGRLVTPGFNDAHIHFLGGGLSLLRVDLNGARTLEEAKRRVVARVKGLPAGAWVTGRGWDHTLWGGQWPTKESLDEVAPDNPVFLQRVDGHVSWVNSLALQKAGVTRETAAPAGGEILRDARGEATGILKETAGTLVARVVPEPSPAGWRQAVERALEEARRYGITSIQDNSGYETTKLYRALKAEGRLTVRVSEWQNFEDTVAELKRQRAEFATFNDQPQQLRLGPLKGYVDGTLGSRTAAMLAPFADDPANSGIPRRPPDELTKMIVERHAEGFQIALHAIGDRANRMALDGFMAALGRPLATAAALGAHLQVSKIDIKLRDPATGRMQAASAVRHRVEHAQVVSPADFARFRDLGVIASMQPAHAISDKRWAQDRLGEYRVLGAYSWHTMLSHGVRVAFGTDWPVEPINPYLGLYAAVTRQSPEGDPAGGWWPQERLSMAEAIRCYTAAPAYASFEELDKGQIRSGMLADLVVHSKDLLTVSPAEVLQTEPVLTVFDGRVVYEKE
jgi:predicted amidohydrolase YtcJ